jgi:hypothetical protein
MATAFHYCSRHITEDVWDDAGEGAIDSNWRVAAGPHWWTGCRPKTALLSFVPGRNGHLRGNGEGGGRERGGKPRSLSTEARGRLDRRQFFSRPGTGTGHMAPVLKCLLPCLCTLRVAVDARVRGMMEGLEPAQTRERVPVLSGGGGIW